MDGRALRVFISYARSDASAFAEDLLQGLEVAGFEPFLDRHDIAATLAACAPSRSER